MFSVAKVYLQTKKVCKERTGRLGLCSFLRSLLTSLRRRRCFYPREQRYPPMEDADWCPTCLSLARIQSTLINSSQEPQHVKPIKIRLQRRIALRSLIFFFPQRAPGSSLKGRSEAHTQNKRIKQIGNRKDRLFPFFFLAFFSECVAIESVFC